MLTWSIFAGQVTFIVVKFAHNYLELYSPDCSTGCRGESIHKKWQQFRNQHLCHFCVPSNKICYGNWRFLLGWRCRLDNSTLHLWVQLILQWAGIILQIAEAVIRIRAVWFLVDVRSCWGNTSYVDIDHFDPMELHYYHVDTDHFGSTELQYWPLWHNKAMILTTLTQWGHEIEYFDSNWATMSTHNNMNTRVWYTHICMFQHTMFSHGSRRISATCWCHWPSRSCAFCNAVWPSSSRKSGLAS